MLNVKWSWKGQTPFTTPWLSSQWVTEGSITLRGNTPIWPSSLFTQWHFVLPILLLLPAWCWLEWEIGGSSRAWSRWIRYQHWVWARWGARSQFLGEVPGHAIILGNCQFWIKCRKREASEITPSSPSRACLCCLLLKASVKVTHEGGDCPHICEWLYLDLRAEQTHSERRGQLPPLRVSLFSSQSWQSLS